MKTVVVLGAVALASAQHPVEQSLRASGFDWRKTELGNLVGAVRNYQSIPGKACGAIGWSFAATSMIADRIHILQPGAPKVQLSDQTILNCVGAGTSFDGCADRGTIELALRQVLEMGGLPDRTCMGWRAVKETCARTNMCINCLPEKCDVRPTYFKHSISAYGRMDVADDAAMTKEIVESGPLACELADGHFCTLVGFTQVSEEGMYGPLTAPRVVYHAKFDLGVAFGERGFGKVAPEALKECWYADVRRPLLFTDKVVVAQLAADAAREEALKREAAAAAAAEKEAEEEAEEETEDEEGPLLGGALSPSLSLSLSNKTIAAAPKHTSSRFEGHLAKREATLRASFGISPRNLQSVPVEDLPESLSWLGRNLITPVQSHHNGPGYCGACWSLASASTFSDMLKISSGGKFAPDVFVSPQTTIDCVKPNGCKGGGADEVFPFYESRGTVDETCNAWVVGEKTCLAGGRGCKVCDAQGNCALAPAKAYDVYKAEAWGNIKGEEAMIQALQRGPIVCGVSCAGAPGLDEMYLSDGSDMLCDPDDATSRQKWAIDHDVSVVGYGVTATGHKYWEVRNSWSTSYGHNGFFKICRGNNNLLIEEACTWVVPKLAQQDDNDNM